MHGWPATAPRSRTSRTPAPGTPHPPSTPFARRRSSANNIIAALRGFELHEYQHKHVGSVASLGLYKGVAEVYGVKVKGFPAWFMHRTYHLSRVPTTSRKAKVLADWTQALFFRREIVSLWSLHRPNDEFLEATGTTPVVLPAVKSTPEPATHPERQPETQPAAKEA